MFFEIENTPEHIRRARRKEIIKKDTPKEECPRLILAPFSRTPQVVFEDVRIGSLSERTLEVYNPSKQAQQITLCRSLPPGLEIHLPGEWLVLEPETCYCLTMMWTPMQPTALRETVRFTNENRGRYDVIVVLKSFVNAKGKGSHQKTFKISPGKIKKKPSKKSPVAIYKKKAEIIYNTTKIKKTYNVVQSSGHKGFKLSNKENMSTFNDYSMESYQDKCPFDSPTSIDFNFDTAEIFSNFRRPTENILQNTYDKCSMSESTLPLSQNILKPLNNQIYNRSASDIFDNLTFTPLKTCNEKSDKLDKGPKIIMSLNSDSELDDSLNVKIDNKENEHHSIICVTSTQPPNKWLTIDHTTIDRHAVVDHHFHQSLDSQYTEPVNIPTKKIPNTSSPKETSSLNFSINTDFSRISDLSFFPQRFSTERKVLPKVNETHEINDDPIKVSSDTYTKESPNTPMEQQARQMYLESRQPHLFVRDNPKMCRQALFRDLQLRATEAYERNSNPYENIFSQNDLRSDMKSPPRSLTPPLQSIPEESTQFSETHVLDKTDKSTATFTINRTFDKGLSRNSLSSSMRQSWSKKAVRVEPELWKLPVPLSRKSLKPKTSFVKDSLTGTISNTREVNKTINQNISLNQTGNVYSQSFTVDPFLSSTYFYDEQAVEKFEIEFKRWLNCILTPPADLESNIEQKIDVGKAWIENRNREVPLAPTKEQVSSRYHNSHRLESLRRAARSLLLSPEIAQVFQKLNAQIEKKLIVIRNDRNLHLDVGLQKIIMELLLSYNPLWLRIGLEAIYGLILPLKSNSDIEGLTSFIIHRMFKNPYLKNKHSKSTAPNMLLPAYMEAIKKFTLKKFFMLVFFLDQAKQRKLISHDPCLFCRNAICKESREIIIRFTRELIAGIGDITKHLRPLGYVVNHKQSYLDEYKFAVHNLALDIRDGVRLTKVMEIILMKNGLLSQLRTPAISRLQKIHNVQVALNALKESNFVIVGDITAQDIADGHREKTLSLLWQIIHVFRAPLFEKAANVIQTWWRKKFEVIVEKRKEEERTRQKQNEAASLIQCWWRRIQYNRYVEWQMRQVTKATIVVQKYWRMWLCRSRFHKLKSSVLKIEDWFRSIKIMKEAKKTLIKLKLEQIEIRRNAATILQSYIRRWLCVKRYKETLKKVVLIQSIVRRFLARTHYLQLKKSVVYVQQKYRSKLLMLKEMQKLAEKKKCVLMIQSYYRMMKQRKLFEKLKKSVIAIEERYIALVNMRYEYKKYQHLKSCTILLQARFRARKYRSEYIKQKNIIIKLQRKIKAQLLMKKERAQYLKLKTATVFLQNRVRSYLAMKLARQHYITLRKSTVLIQRRIRLYLLMKTQRNSYLQLRNAVIVIQKYYRNMSAMRQARSSFLKLKNAAVVVQRQFRAQILMKHNKREYETLRSTAVLFQRRFRAQMKMREERVYMRLRLSCITIQIFYRSYLLGKRERKCFLKQREAAITIQKWFRNCQKTKVTKQEYKQLKQACVTIQRIYRTNIISRNQRQEYIRLRTATVCIQKYYRSYVEMKVVRDQYIQLKTATVSIQKFYKRYMQTKKQQLEFLQIKTAVQVIQRSYRHYKQAKMIRLQYCQLRQTAIYIQRKYKSLMAMRRERKAFLDLKKSVCIIQHQFRALHAMRRQREAYLNLRSAILVLQTRFRAQCLMKKVRSRYITILKACITIQVYYRAYVTGKKQRECYLKMKRSAVILQQQFRALIAMKKDRNSYLTIRSATLTIQNKFRAHSLMLEHRKRYQETVKACIAIQRAYTAYRLGKKQRIKYIKIKLSIINIQKWFRNIKRTKQIRNQYQELRNAVIYTQRRFRANVVKREQRRNEAAARIQTWYRSLQKRNECQTMYLKIKVCIIKIQSIIRMYILRKRFVTMKNAAVTIQSHYRSFNLTKTERQKYIQIRKFIIRLQSIVRCYIARQRYLKLKSAVLTVQAAYRLKRQRCITRKRREAAAICIQKNVRRYFVQSWYQSFLKRVTYIQKLWRGKLLTRRIRYEFLRNRNVITKLQAAIKGYLVRKHIQCKREEMLKKKELQQRHWAASRIQALFRGHKARIDVSGDRRVAELRRRWREGALQSTQESLKERNEEAMEVLRNMSDIETVIRAFRSLELLTEVFPMMYNSNASSIVRRVYIYMSVTNRSISSIEVLKSAASVLVNLTRYRITGPKIYARDRIPPILKFMWRFSNSETHLFCILSTYLWLFSKYDVVREDLQEFLHMPENVKILVTIKKNVERMKRMASNARKSHTPQSSKFVSHTGNQSYSDLNYSLCSTSKNSSILLPALEPDYGIVRADKPRYFEDAYQAISCLFYTFKL